MKKFLIFILLLTTTTFFSQNEKDRGFYKDPKHYVSMQIVGPSIVSYHYEHSIINTKGFAILGEAGIGLAELSESESNPPVPAVYAFHFRLPIQYSFKGVEVIACVSPSLYQHGELGFVNLTGQFGLRTNFSKRRFYNGPFLGIFYTPKLYETVSNSQSMFTHFDVSIKFGVSF